MTHGGGQEDDVDTYMMNFYLPNKVLISGVLVSENRNIVDRIDAIIAGE